MNGGIAPITALIDLAAAPFGLVLNRITGCEQCRQADDETLSDLCNVAFWPIAELAPSALGP